MNLKRMIVVLMASSAFVMTARADNATPRERLEHATAASSLDDLNVKPWRAKLSVTLFDAKGENPVDGTIDYSKAGDDWLQVITVGANTETTLRHDGKTYRGVSGSDVPFLATSVIQEFLHPGPLPLDLDGSTPELRKQSFGKVSLDCVMLSQPIKRMAYAPLGLFPTYCLDSGSDSLRISYDFGSRAVVMNRVGKFLEREVAIEFSMSEGTVVVAKSRVVSLVSFAPAPDTFLPGSLVAPVVAPITKISSGVMQGMRLTSPQPAYPDDARAAHISGSVVLRAIIGRDGHIHTLRVMSAGDPSLALAALAAVRRWTYKPYLLNGEPTEVDTTVVVNFNLNPS